MRNLLLFNAGERDADAGSRGATVLEKRKYREREEGKKGGPRSLYLDEVVRGIFDEHDDSSYLSINCADVEVQLEGALAVERGEV